jgi:hypothetical protein
MTLPIRRRITAVALAPALVAAAVAISPSGASQAASSASLNGTFKLQAGSFSHGKADGTYFRMYRGAGKYLENPDSRASDKTYTLGRPGKDGGLVTGAFQSHPSPPFDGRGNARANRIILPESYTAIKFSVATLPKDPQSKKNVATTSARVSGRRLTVNLPGFTAEWNKQYFNQGAPKPNGSGAPATGIYNAKTKHFTLSWRSRISGGVFDGYSGLWHLEGTFVAD